MPIMRGPSGSNKTFKIPCSGEGIFVIVNTVNSSGAIVYWNGTSKKKVVEQYLVITSITVENGIATVDVNNPSGNDSSIRVCFIPGNPLASN